MSKTNNQTMDIISKVSRFTALLMLAVFSFAGLEYYRAEMMTANIILDSSVAKDNFFESQKNAIALKNQIKNLNLETIAKSYQSAENLNVFISEASKWQNIAEVKTKEISDGIFVYVLAGASDSLHPYFGFFSQEKIVWGQSAKLEITDEEKTDTHYIFTFINKSDYPIVTSDSYLDKKSNSEITFVSENKKNIIQPNETGFLISEKESFFIQNTNWGYYFEIEK